MVWGDENGIELQRSCLRSGDGDTTDEIPWLTRYDDYKIKPGIVEQLASNRWTNPEDDLAVRETWDEEDPSSVTGD